MMEPTLLLINSQQVALVGILALFLAGISSCVRNAHNVLRGGDLEVPTGCGSGAGLRSRDTMRPGGSMRHLTMEELEAGLEEIRRSPTDEGILQLIVRRPATLEREVIQEGRLDLAEGLVGDNWRTRGSKRTADGSAHPEMQLTIMNARTIALLAQDSDRWKLAGDQLFVDLDMCTENLPPGTRLALGSGIVEITNQPHTGCKKFTTRFGSDAVKFVNSPLGRELHLRGVNARVIQAGAIHVGDVVRKLGIGRVS